MDPNERSKDCPPDCGNTAQIRQTAVGDLFSELGSVLADLAFDAVFAWELPGKITFWNRSAAELYGFSANQAIGRVPDELLKTRSPHLELSRASLEREGSCSTILQRCKSSGAAVDVESRQRLFHQEGRRIVLEVNRERALPRDEFLSTVIGSAMDAIVVVDEFQRVVIFNPAAESMFQCAASEAAGSSLDRFIPERFRGAHRNHVRRFGETNVTRRRMNELGAVYGLRSNGEEFPIEASISSATVAGSKTFTVILRDVSEKLRD